MKFGDRIETRLGMPLREAISWWWLSVTCFFRGHDWETRADIWPEAVVEGRHCHRCFRFVKTWEA